MSVVDAHAFSPITKLSSVQRQCTHATFSSSLEFVPFVHMSSSVGMGYSLAASNLPYLSCEPFCIDLSVLLH